MFLNWCRSICSWTILSLYSTDTRPKKHFMDHIKANLLKCNIKPSDLEALAGDRDIWRTVCDTGLRSFLTGWITASEERRASHSFNHAKDQSTMSSVQQSLGFRIQTTEPHAVLHQVQQHPSYSAMYSSNSMDFSSSSSSSIINGLLVPCSSL